MSPPGFFGGGIGVWFDGRREMTRIFKLAAVLFASVTATSAATAQDDLDLSACIDAVGSYLLLRVEEDDGEERLGRMVLSLTNGGHAFLTDSAQVGLYGQQPFTGGGGAWKCIGAEDGFAAIKAVIIDFTFSTPHDPQAKIKRLDLEATYDARQDVFEGKAVVRHTPLSGNPFDAVQMEDGKDEFSVTGQQIAVPD